MFFRFSACRSDRIGRLDRTTVDSGESRRLGGIIIEFSVNAIRKLFELNSIKIHGTIDNLIFQFVISTHHAVADDDDRARQLTNDIDHSR